jgi:hypothetical protein
MSRRSTMPPSAHKLYMLGLILIIIFVIISWAVTAYSIGAPLIAINQNHHPTIAPEQCLTCHRTETQAPKLKHVEFPTCGYCHRFIESNK